MKKIKNTDPAPPVDNIFLMDPQKGYGPAYIENASGQPWDYYGRRLYLYRKTKAGEIVPWEPKPDLTCSPFGLFRAIYAWWEDTKEIFGAGGTLLEKVRIGLLGGILLGMAFMIIMAASEISGG